MTDPRHRLLERLHARQEADRLGASGQVTVELDKQSVGRLSRMDALQQQAMAKATAGRRGQEIKKLNAALQRVKDGDYGSCTDCGEQIEPRRLEFDPATPRCLSCSRG